MKICSNENIHNIIVKLDFVLYSFEKRKITVFLCLLGDLFTSCTAAATAETSGLGA